MNAERKLRTHSWRKRCHVIQLLPVTCLLSSLLLVHRPEVTCASWSPVAACPSACLCQTGSGSVTCHRADLVHIPSIPETTFNLDLDHNHISLLQNGSLHRTPRLQFLSLQDNGILHLERGVFDALHGLRVLRLGRNHLSSLPADVFAFNHRLEELDLHANYFAHVPDNVMFSLHSLQALNVSFNQLTSADLGLGFRYTTRLSVIDLSGNDLSSLGSGSFEVMSSWDDQSGRHINLSYCNLRHIDKHSLQRVPRLVSLSLEGNPRIPQHDLQAALRNMDLDGLQSIDLSHMNITDIVSFVQDFRAAALVDFEMSFNRLKVIPKGTFFFFVNLRHLGLSHNEISSIENLAGLSKLENLYLAYNNIDRLDEMMFEGLHELRVLDVSHNRITRIDDEPFLNLFNLHTIDVSNNQVYQFQISGGLESLETLQAGWNRVSNVRFLQRLRRLSAVDLCHNAITRLGEEIFARGQKISYANFSGNVINEINPNAFRFGDYEVVDLSHNRLMTLGHHGWQSVKVLHLQNNILHNLTANSLRNMNQLRELHLQGNRLHALPRQLFIDLHNLTYLDLSFNPIGPYLELLEAARTVSKLEKLEVLYLQRTSLAQVSHGLFQNLTNLRRLDLSHNRLSRFGGETLPLLSNLDVLDLSYNAFEGIQVNVLENSGRQSKVIDLSANPFDCSCDLVPLCRRLFEAGQLTVVNVDNRTLYQCASPSEWTGVPVSEFYESSRQCSNLERAIIFVIIICILVAIIIIITVTVCRYRTWKRQKHKTVSSSSSSSRPTMNYKFVDETSLTSSSNSSSNNGGQAPSAAAPPTTACLLSKQWV